MAKQKWRRWAVNLGWGVGLGLLCANLLAWRHAHAMLFYVAGATRPPRLEAITGLRNKLALLISGVAIPRPENDATPAAVDLPYETRLISLPDGEHLEAWWIPHAAPQGMVVAFHGYQAAKCSLLGEARGFYDLGYSVLLVDFRGSGGSSGNTTTLGFREADDVAAAFAYAREITPGLPVILHGQSMGAAAILRAVAVNGIRPDALIAEAVFDNMLSTTRNRFRMLGAPPFPAADLLLLWGGMQTGFNPFRHNPATYATAVTVPTLVLCGGLDRRAPMAEARAVYDQLSGPKAFACFPKAGHESFMGRSSRRWKLVIDKFLTAQVNKLDPQGVSRTPGRTGQP